MTMTIVLLYDKVLVLSCIDDLHCHVDKTQLTVELGGTLLYDHQEWIQHRAVSFEIVAHSKLHR